MEGRSSIGAQVTLPNGDVKEIQITAIPAVEQIRIDKLRPPGDEPLPPLGRREIYLERSGRPVLGLTPGDILQVELADGRVRELEAGGLRPGLHVTCLTSSANLSALTPIRRRSLTWGAARLHTLLLSVAEDSETRSTCAKSPKRRPTRLEASGREVYFTLVYQPGRHFASDITKALAGVDDVPGDHGGLPGRISW